jgi:hypothetical protein
MKIGDVVKNAPNALIYSVALCFVAVISAFTVLSAMGANTADLRAFLVPIGTVLSALLSGGALIVSGAAAKSSANAEQSSANTEDQTNGKLDQKIEKAVRRAIYAPDGGNLPDSK